MAIDLTISWAQAGGRVDATAAEALLQSLGPEPLPLSRATRALLSEERADNMAPRPDFPRNRYRHKDRRI